MYTENYNLQKENPLSDATVTPIRFGFTVEQLIEAHELEIEKGHQKFIAYAEAQGWPTTDADGNPLTSNEIAWNHIQSNNVLMDTKPQLRAVN